MPHCARKRLQMERPSTLGSGSKKSPKLDGNAAWFALLSELIDRIVLALAVLHIFSVDAVSFSLCTNRAKKKIGPPAGLQAQLTSPQLNSTQLNSTFLTPFSSRVLLVYVLTGQVPGMCNAIRILPKFLICVFKIMSSVAAVVSSWRC